MEKHHGAKRQKGKAQYGIAEFNSVADKTNDRQ
jgi:hypothetical protein